MSKNTVLPQGFDRFFDNGYCGTDPQAEDGAPTKNDAKLDTDPQAGALSSGAEPGLDPEDEEENTNPGSSASSSSVTNKETSKGSSNSSR